MAAVMPPPSVVVRKLTVYPRTVPRTILYLALVGNGIAIAHAIHVFVAALAVSTQELDNTIWVYRDLMTLGRFPVPIYAETIRLLLIYPVPIAVMTSFPVKGVLGLLSLEWIAFAFGLALPSPASRGGVRCAVTCPFRADTGEPAPRTGISGLALEQRGNLG
jgi:hypothetical protein